MPLPGIPPVLSPRGPRETSIPRSPSSRQALPSGNSLHCDAMSPSRIPCASRHALRRHGDEPAPACRSKCRAPGCPNRAPHPAPAGGYLQSWSRGRPTGSRRGGQSFGSVPQARRRRRFHNSNPPRAPGARSTAHIASRNPVPGSVRNGCPKSRIRSRSDSWEPLW